MSFRLSRRRDRNGRIDRGAVWLTGPAAILGAVAGSSTAAFSDPSILRKGFALLLIVSSALLVVNGSTKPRSPHAAAPILPRNLLPLLGFAAGFAGSFLGIGGGIIIVPALILLFAYPVAVVAGTSSAVIVFVGTAGGIAYMIAGQGAGLHLPGWSTGYVWWTAAAPLALGGVPGAMLGARLNARTKAKTLQRVFGAVLFALAVKILFS